MLIERIGPDRLYSVEGHCRFRVVARCEYHKLSSRRLNIVSLAFSA